MGTESKSTVDWSRGVIVSIRMVDIEKRYIPVKHYVYIMNVIWSDGSEQTVYRKYSDFFDFHIKLMDIFPEETGKSSTKCSIIPSLTGGKKQREVRNTAMHRKMALEEYCRILVNLDPRISQHDVVIQFFDQSDSDRTPSNDARIKPSKSKLLTALGLFSSNLKKSKDNNSSSSSLNISKPIQLETYKAIADYQGTEKDQITFSEDDLVEVIEKNSDGWWLIQIDNEQGWAPASFLQPYDEISDPDEPPPLYNYEQYLAVENYNAMLQDEVTMKKGAIVNVMHKLLDGWWIVQ
ncbi:hypothetical protein LSH36_7g12059 [Paralvinella palmiformis]|uniref:Uncharacterized protein n=1 Tax=Paralvinella palmiformis TaxID=53620 RepID=A0AAD9NGT6_9ANNE|nr:hypothetical protein LSH36_7g12059 [Paralvinella palmiformis]